jgi:hypothetical protein
MALSHVAAIVSRLYIFFVCFFLAIAPQGNCFGILYLDSHIILLSVALSRAAVIVSRLYISWYPYGYPRLQIPSLLNRREAPKFFDIREILKKKEAATDTPHYFFKKSMEGGIHYLKCNVRVFFDFKKKF